MNVPKDGSKPAQKLREGELSGPIAALGDELYFAGDRHKLAHMHLDGSGYTDLTLEMGATNDIQSDGTAIYAGNFGCYDDAGISIVSRGGAETKLDVHCPHALAGRNGVVYFITGPSDGPKSVQFASANRKPRTLVPAQAIDERYLAVTERYVYFYVYKPDNYLVRVPVQGGALEPIASTGLPSTLYASGPHECCSK